MVVPDNSQVRLQEQLFSLHGNVEVPAALCSLGTVAMDCQMGPIIMLE